MTENNMRVFFTLTLKMDEMEPHLVKSLRVGLRQLGGKTMEAFLIPDLCEVD